MLDGIDTLVFDIQDIGVRFYTYISTMKLAMEAARGCAGRLRRTRSTEPRSVVFGSKVPCYTRILRPLSGLLRSLLYMA